MSYELLLGDAVQVMKGMADGSVDMVFADPPYNVGLKYATHNDNVGSGAYLAWCMEWFAQCRRVSKSCVVITPGMVNVPMWIADIERTHFLIAWTKQNNCSRNYIGKTSGFQTWEPILVFGKAKRVILRDSVDIPISTQSDAAGHPCPKPLRLMKWIVKNFTDPGDTVLDCFAGSGSTGVACIKSTRNFIGCEISPEYHTIALRRLQDAAAQPSLFAIDA